MLKTLSSALQLTQFFTREQPLWGVRELAKASGMHHSVVHRMLATFAEEGFLIQDERGRYGLGLKWFEIGEVVRHSISPTALIEPVLNQLMQKSGETVFLSLLHGQEGMTIDVAHSEQQLRFSSEEGQRFPLYAGAHGKAILAFLPAATRESIYTKALERHVSLNPTAIEEQLAVIRERGWAYTCEETAQGVAGLALPLWSTDKKTVIGSLVIAGPMQRLDEAAVPRLLDTLQSAQRQIESMIGLMR